MISFPSKSGEHKNKISLSITSASKDISNIRKSNLEMFSMNTVIDINVIICNGEFDNIFC